MNDNRQVWVFVEQDEGKIAPVSLELVGKARVLADRLGGSVSALVCGYKIAELPPAVIGYGADRVLLVDHSELNLYRTLPYAKVLIELVKERRPYIFLL